MRLSRKHHPDAKIAAVRKVVQLTARLRELERRSFTEPLVADASEGEGIVKGIVDPRDAWHAVGARGLVVSNHGGRLDAVAATTRMRICGS